MLSSCSLSKTLKKSQENIKILRQYTKLLTQACHPTLETALTAHVQPLSRTPLSYPRALHWFQPLTAQYQPPDALALERVVSLLELRAACNQESFWSAPAMQCEAAAQLAQELPHFDRDLTAFYLSSPLAAAPAATELDLHIAHSVLRLHGGISHPDPNLTRWRSQGLVHVLSVAAHHMPTVADWFPSIAYPAPDPATDEDARALAHFLDRINATPRDYAGAIECFIATLNGSASPTAQAVAILVDRLAILMGVKSDAALASGHDLAAALASFPHFHEDDAATSIISQPHEIWASIRAALQRSMPPSILRVDPDSSCLKKRIKKNTGEHQQASSSSITGTW